MLFEIFSPGTVLAMKTNTYESDFLTSLWSVDTTLMPTKTFQILSSPLCPHFTQYILLQCQDPVAVFPGWPWAEGVFLNTSWYTTTAFSQLLAMHAA